jgi:hypothetical protein
VEDGPASGYAVVGDLTVKSVVINEVGSAYSSPSIVTIMGREGVQLNPTLHYDKAFKKNGAVESVKNTGRKPGR